METTPAKLQLSGYEFRFSRLPASSALTLTPVVGKIIAAALSIPSVAKTFLGKDTDLAKVDISTLASAVGEICDAMLGIALSDVMLRLLATTVAVKDTNVFQLGKSDHFDSVFTDIGVGVAFQVALHSVKLNFKGFIPAR